MASKKKSTKRAAEAEDEKKSRSGKTYTFAERKARGTGMNMTITIDETRREKLDRLVAAGKAASRSALIAAWIDRAQEK